jgi:hypothetical protein
MRSSAGALVAQAEGPCLKLNRVPVSVLPKQLLELLDVFLNFINSRMHFTDQLVLTPRKLFDAFVIAPNSFNKAS